MQDVLIRLENAWGWAEVSVWGAQVLRAVPHGGTDLLWQTDAEFLDKARAAGKALRAGIPLCWPWFLGHPGGVPGAPSHGLGRILSWEVVAEPRGGAPEAEVCLRTEVDMTPWGTPTMLAAEVRIALLARGIGVRLTTRNVGGRGGAVPIGITQSLHTYVRVGALAEVRLHGLAGMPNRHVQTREALPPVADAWALEGLVDRVFSWDEPTTGTVRVHDASLGRVVAVAGGLEIAVQPEGGDVVVFNPGPEKAKSLDMQPEHYANFVCVETASIVRPVVLGPGEACSLWTEITQEAWV